MTQLRSILFVLVQALVTPVYAAVMLLFAWLPRVSRYRMAASWCSVVLFGARWMCGIPVLPVAHNAGYLWPKGILGKRAGTITISFGPPIASTGKDAQKLTAEIETWIENEVARLSVPH